MSSTSSSTTASALPQTQHPSKGRAPDRTKEAFERSQHPDPSLVENAWEVLSNHVRKYDNETTNGWKEDIDTLLVFAGLFSAVVTAFTVESYKWLSEDPADINVALLTQISSHLSGANATVHTQAVPFQPSPPSIRINACWFLSLILSLSSSLFCLLCKQWLREHRRETHTRTQEEAQALRQLRRDSFEKWGVPTLLSTLPCLLEIALLIFFAGVLDLLWTLQVSPVFITGGTAIVISGSFYLIITLLPGVSTIASIFWDVKNMTSSQYPHYEVTCPYKSPLAWAVFRIVGSLVTLDPIIHPLFRFTVGERRRQAVRFFRGEIDRAIDCSVLDLRLIHRSRWYPSRSFYCLAGLRSLVTTLYDTPSILPSLTIVVCSLPPPETIPVVFNEWRLSMWFEPSKEDVEDFISVSDHFPSRLSARRQTIGFISSDHFLKPALPPRLMTLNWQLLSNYRSLARSYEKYVDNPGILASQVQRAVRRSLPLLERNVPERTGLHFILPFYISERLWSHSDHRVQAVSLELLTFYECGWKTYPQPSSKFDAQVEESEDERYALVSCLSKHLITHGLELTSGSSSASVLLTSQRGINFLVDTNDHIVRHHLYNTTLGTRMKILDEWRTVIARVCQIHSLPAERFKVIPTPKIDVSVDRGGSTGTGPAFAQANNS
ncbi:hypothetical protein PQX77_019926 [Marasmius sp. AFHP31]|nr:hypothetical protein PQX77_019926 [Marasmius sp. AFHP31]